MATRVLVDVDDTIAETQVLLIDQINAKGGTQYTFDSMTRAHRENAKEHKEWNEGVWAILKQPEVLSTIQPSPGAVEAFIELAENEAEPHIVTARKSLLFECTDTWLADHGFWDVVEDTHRRRDGERGDQFKVRVAKEVGFDAAFEDTADVAMALAPHVRVLYLIDKPWNRDVDFPPNVIRVSSFAEGVERYLDSL